MKETLEGLEFYSSEQTWFCPLPSYRSPRIMGRRWEFHNSNFHLHCKLCNYETQTKPGIMCQIGLSGLLHNLFQESFNYTRTTDVFHNYTLSIDGHVLATDRICHIYNSALRNMKKQKKMKLGIMIEPFYGQFQYNFFQDTYI